LAGTIGSLSPAETRISDMVTRKFPAGGGVAPAARAGHRDKPAASAATQAARRPGAAAALPGTAALHRDRDRHVTAARASGPATEWHARPGPGPG
jgi:hypothetical protein